MSKKLTFQITPALLALAQHAVTATEKTFGYDVLFEDEFHKGGRVKLGPDNFPDRGNIDPARLRPSLLLVKDQGVYLMSGGLPNLPQGSNVVYADQSNPITMAFDDWYDAARDIMGGDDTVITLFDLPQRVIDAAAAGAQRLEMAVTPTSVSVSIEIPGDSDVPAAPRQIH